MISSISSNSSNWYKQTNNETLSTLISAATNKNLEVSKISLTSSDTSDSSDSSSNGAKANEFMELMKAAQNTYSLLTEEVETKTGDISSVDTDGDGTISSDEYEELISMLGIDDALSAEDFFAQYDADKNGEISSAEMNAMDNNIPMMPHLPPGPPPEEETLGLSSEIDTDSDGTLSVEEYESMISQYGISDALSSEEFFTKYDTDEDGKINADEIQAMKTLTNNTIKAYEKNYQYMAENIESNLLNSIV